MIDVKILRENPEFVRNAIAKKKFSCDLDAFLVLDAKRREQVAEAENARAEQKAFNDKMAALKKGSPEFLEAVQGMKVIAARVKELEAAAKE
ncbi:MAG: serine--tRNA ligase, partial [Verrucomicrobia bacterium CG22_combo_CG10-13_8_21_14_all_43_17]